MSLSNEYGVNIQNAFSVVYKTLESVKKLMEYCDRICEESEYISSTNKFLRNKSDGSVDGWVYNKFFKVYQSRKDTLIESNEWRDGPLYVLEINLEEEPKYYLSIFNYKDVQVWKKGISPADWWAFYFPTNIGDNRINFKAIDNVYTESSPIGSYKNTYWGLERVVFRSGNLFDLNRDTVKELIFEEFNKLRTISDRLEKNQNIN